MATVQKHHMRQGHEVFPFSSDWSCCPFKARLSGCLFLPASPFDYACPPVTLAEFLKCWQERLIGSWCCVCCLLISPTLQNPAGTPPMVRPSGWSTGGFKYLFLLAGYLLDP